MDVPGFVISTQRRCKAGSISEVVLDFTRCGWGRWRINANEVVCLEPATNDTVKEPNG